MDPLCFRDVLYISNTFLFPSLNDNISGSNNPTRLPLKTLLKSER